jgi:GxxExxY protein
MHADEEILNVLSRKVIGGAFTILNTPGAGFLERIYENSLVQALRETGLTVARNRDRRQAG